MQGVCDGDERGADDGCFDGGGEEADPEAGWGLLAVIRMAGCGGFGRMEGGGRMDMERRRGLVRRRRGCFAGGGR